MHDRLFEAALGIVPPWSVVGVRFDEASKVLTVGIDFTAGSRFALDGATGEHPVHDTVTKTYRHLNFFQHECVLEVRTPRVKLPDGSVHQVKPPFAGKLSGFTLLFEALVLMLAAQMPFAAVARIVDYLPRAASAADQQLMKRIDALNLAQPFAGSRMLRDMLHREGFEVGRRHVATLMRRMGIEALCRKPNTKKKHPTHKVYHPIADSARSCARARPRHRP
jgi:hypothetical protein